MNLEKLEACKKVCVNLGRLGTDRRASGSLGSLETSKRVPVISGESVKVLSLRALRARAGGDHIVAQFWTNFGAIWDQSVTNLKPNWDQFWC